MHDIITASLLPYRRMEFHEKMLFKNHENTENCNFKVKSNFYFDSFRQNLAQKFFANGLKLIFEAKIQMTFLSLDLVDLLDHFIILICKAPNGIFGFIAPAREERLGRLLRNLDEL